tara:strand:+ start:314 stop:421 length:108 start_codon:yes stop_codon:yes gene_type:complete
MPKGELAQDASAKKYYASILEGIVRRRQPGADPVS